MLSGLSDGPEWVLGGILMLFAATAVLVVTAAIAARRTSSGLRRSDARWSGHDVVDYMGRRASARSTGFPVAVGYFVMWVGVVVVIFGTVIVFTSIEEGFRPRSEEASPSPEVRQSS